jgi:DNA invertase Pin-like site-specific DNA recombinase
MPEIVKKPLRCAIYTRVSTEYGLEQEFNSLDNQREAAEAFVKSQAHEGWRALREIYDDGGFSGGSMDRPALQKLLADIRARKVDVVVVYKVDRLTRSLADFAKLVELFDTHEVSFVSVTQAFNTTNSMGRLTLNVLLSFAQFEREVTGERIRDKIAASKRKGMRMGGPIPLGYDVKDKKLVVNTEEASQVRLIFQRYLDLGCLTKTLEDLHRRRVVTKRTHRKDGSVRGGIPFGRGALSSLLKNRTYVGEIVHKEQYFPGEHASIVETTIFDAVQTALAAHARGRSRNRTTDAFLLTSKIFDDCGNRMVPSTSKKDGVYYRYYVSSVINQGRKNEAGSVLRVSAPDVEAVVMATVQKERAARKTQSNGLLSDDVDQIGDCIDRVVVRAEKLEVSVRIGDEGSEIISVPWTPTVPTRRRAIIMPVGSESESGRPIRSETRARLIEAIAKARRWVEELVSGQVTSTEQIAKRENCSERAVRMTLSLAFLAPQIVEATVAGQLSDHLGSTVLVNPPLEWRLLGPTMRWATIG